MDPPETAPKHPVPPQANLAKSPPCDQCRRRKVKCDTGAPCDRCVQSGLRCTRDIVRKRRGPKKGSGSVIAKLKNENEQILSPVGGSLSYDLPPMDSHPLLHRSMSNSTATSSPYSEGFGPTSDPSIIFHGPTSAPQQVPEGQIQINPITPLQFPSPGSRDGLLSVSDLAHRIFDRDGHQLSPDLSSMSLSDASAMTASPNGPGSLDAMTFNRPIESPAAASIGSPHNYDGPKYLYRTHSNPVAAESRVIALAAEFGMSAYLMSQCIRQYFRHLYPVWPILHEATFCHRLNEPEDLPADEKCLVLSMCAITVLHGAPMSDLNLSGKKALGRQFLTHSLSLRRDLEWIERATLTTVIASFFTSLSYFELKQPRSHYFYLREAIGLATELGIHQENTYAGLSQLQAICYRRTFAVLFVTERGYAILRNKPASIARLPDLPTVNFEDEDPSIIAGFECICRLFGLLDENFVELWRMSAAVDEDDAMIQFEDITAIQQSLNAASFESISLTDIQKADVLITHQWLRLIFWHASMRHGLISSSAHDPAFRYEYPIIIAKALCHVMHQLPLDSILVHGLGIFEKIFEVSYTLMDALTIAKVDWTESDELRYLFSCLSASPNSQNTYVRMLETKMNSQQSLVPKMENGIEIPASIPSS